MPNQNFLQSSPQVTYKAMEPHFIIYHKNRQIMEPIVILLLALCAMLAYVIATIEKFLKIKKFSRQDRGPKLNNIYQSPDSMDKIGKQYNSHPTRGPNQYKRRKRRRSFDYDDDYDDNNEYPRNRREKRRRRRRRPGHRLDKLIYICIILILLIVIVMLYGYK